MNKKALVGYDEIQALAAYLRNTRQEPYDGLTSEEILAAYRVRESSGWYADAVRMRDDLGRTCVSFWAEGRERARWVGRARCVLCGAACGALGQPVCALCVPRVQAAREADGGDSCGWDLFNAHPDGSCELERDDDADVYEDDATAAEHVRTLLRSRT